MMLVFRSGTRKLKLKFSRERSAEVIITNHNHLLNGLRQSSRECAQARCRTIKIHVPEYPHQFIEALTKVSSGLSDREEFVLTSRDATGSNSYIHGQIRRQPTIWSGIRLRNSSRLIVVDFDSIDIAFKDGGGREIVRLTQRAFNYS